MNRLSEIARTWGQVGFRYRPDPTIAALLAGLLVALLGWPAALGLWPLLAVPFVFTRFGPQVVGATLIGVLTATGIAQLNSVLPILYTPGEVYYGEAIIYDQAARILHGQPLFLPHDRPPYSHTAYMPLYYWAVAGLRAVMGPGFLPGRALEGAAGLATVAMVGYIVAQRAGAKRAGVLAALAFLSLGLPWVYSLEDTLHSREPLRTLWASLLAPMAPGAAPLVALKEDLLGVALSIGAIAVLAGGTTSRRVECAGVLAALAFLTKQTFVSAGLAGVVWLWLVDRKAAVRFGAVGLFLAVGVMGAYELTTHAFFENVIFANVNPVRPDVLALNLATLIRFQLGPTIVAAVFAVGVFRRRPSGVDGLLVLFWLATILPAAGISRVGAAANHWFIYGASTAVLATVAFWRYVVAREEPSGRPLLDAFWGTSRLVGLVRPQWPGWRASLAGALLLVTVATVAPINNADRMRPRWPTPPDPASFAEFNATIARVRSEPREVLSAALDVVALAERPVLLEPYIFSVLWSQGQWDPQPLIRRICGRQIGLLLFYNPLEYGSGTYQNYSFWPLPVLEALQEMMVFESRLGYLYVYTPRPTDASAPAGGGGARVCSS